MADDVNVIPNAYKTNKAMKKALLRSYFEELVRRTPFKTGDTAGRWELKNPEPLVFEFYNPEGIIIMSLEGGRKPGIIKARDGHFLRFKKAPRKSAYKKIPGNIAWEKDGFIYAKMVRHPGFEARRFIRKLIEDQKVAEKFNSIFMKELGLA